jgi:hypothetical protein
VDMRVVEDIEEMMIEKDLVCVHEAEVQKVIKIVHLLMVVVVVEIDQEIVWVVAVEEIDIKSIHIIFFFFSYC